MTTVVLTPTLSGHDGLSMLARQVVAAVASSARDTVHVVALAAASGGEWPANISVTDCGGRRTEFVWRVNQFARFAPALRIICLHAHLLPATWTAVRRGATLVPVLVGVEAWRPLSWTRRRVLARAARAIAISHHTAQKFRDANPAFGSMPIDICWPATPPQMISAAAGPIAAPRRSVPFALIVGRLSIEDRYKGHDVLIDVWPQVQQACPGARLVIAGTGDDETRLRARVAECGLSHAIDLVGAQSEEALQQLYRDCALFVMPSRHEGFGLVFLEAMAAGRACIGGHGAAAEIIVDEETGLIVDPTSATAVRDAVVRLLRDPTLATVMGERGRRRGQQVFSTERFATDLQRALAAFQAEPVTSSC